MEFDMKGDLLVRIVRVTNLANDGPGSFRAALIERGPRVVIFEVTGSVVLDEPLVVN